MKVRDVFTTPATWIKGMYARDGEGNGIRPQDPEAKCFCLQGAIRKCYDPAGDFSKEYMRVRDLVCTRLGGSDIPSWNDADERTFKQVKQLVEELDI